MYDTDLDCSTNKTAITDVVPSEHDHALVIDDSFVLISGKHTEGLDRFWNDNHTRTEKGIEISTLAKIDLTFNCAYCLSVEQTPPSPRLSEQEATRMNVYLD